MVSVLSQTAGSAPGMPVSITTRPTTRSSVLARGDASGTQHSRWPTWRDSSKQAMLMRSAALRSSAKIGAPAHVRTGRAHLVERSLAVPGADVYGPDRVL